MSSSRQISVGKNNSPRSRRTANLIRLAATVGVGVQQGLAFSWTTAPSRSTLHSGAAFVNSAASRSTSSSAAISARPYGVILPPSSPYLSAWKPLYMAGGMDSDDTGVMDEEEEEEYVEIVDEGARLEPKPPSIPPMVDEQLENDLLEAERRVQLYEMEIEMMREQLVLKSEQLQEEQNTFRGEKASLMDKIVEFTSILAQRDEELAAKSEEASADAKAKEEELRQEVKSLIAQLGAKTAAYENEVNTTKELKKRFEEANDALEFEQMAFQKEKDSLQNTIEGERKNIKALESKLLEAQASFDKVREDLMKKLQSEQEKLMTTEGAWEKTKEALQTAQQKLQDTLKEKEDSLKESKRELDSQKRLFDGEREELKKQIKMEQITVKNVREELKQEQDTFEKSKKELESAIAQERSTVRRLQEEMVREQTRFDNDRANLEERIREESERLSLVEQELAKERDNYSKMKEQLEYKLSEEIRVNKLKKRQMNERYTEIRREMTALWEGTKRDARKEQARLMKKYEKKIADVQKEVSRLDSDLIESKESSKELGLLLAQAEAKQKSLIADSEALEAKYKVSLLDMSGLQKVIDEKKVVIAEQEKQLEKYETSFRAVARLSMKVTGNKIKGAGSRVKRAGGSLKRLIQNNPSED